MDWIRFFDEYRISYTTSGPNVAKGNICTHCPWCGLSDPSEHLSINLSGKGFRCWRDPSHSGKNPAKLIQVLLKCSWEQAERLSGVQRTIPGDFLGKIKSTLLKTQKEEKVAQQLVLPNEFKEFSPLRPSCKPYVGYLLGRNFTRDDIFYKTTKYGIYYATQGLYKGRIIFTIMQDGKLCGWTGRTIYFNEKLRYKTLTSDPEKAAERGETPAPDSISSFLLFFDGVANPGAAHTIVLVEGPFDAWRINLLGEELGIKSTCFFTSTLSNQQLNLLHCILPEYKERYLLLDQNTFAKSQRIRADLASLNVVVKKLPPNFKDPAELKTQKDLQNVLAIV